MILTRRKSFIILLTYVVRIAIGQYARDTIQFKENFEHGVEILEDEIRDHPDVRYEFDPSKRLLPNDQFTFNFPDIEDYRIGILMDPVSMSLYIDGYIKYCVSF